MTTDPWAEFEQVPAQDAKSDPWAEFEAVPTDQPKKKTDTSITGAFKRGGEDAANALGGLVSEAGKHIGGGKTFPKLMAKVAQYLHNDNYRSGSEDMMDPNATLGQRAAGLGRALIENSPAMVGAVAGPAGIAATSGLLGAGSAVNRVRAADAVPEDQALNPQQLARVGASSAIDAAGAFIPAGKALAPLGKQLGAEGVKDALAATLSAAKAGAISSAAQTAAQKGLLEGEVASLPELASSAAVGGVAAGGVRGLRAVPEAGEAIRFRQFAQDDPKILAAVADRIKAQEATYGKLREENAGNLVDQARGALDVSRANHARNGLLLGPDIVKHAVDGSALNGNTALPYVYGEVQRALRDKVPVSSEHIKDLKAGLAGRGPEVDNWINSVEQESVLNRLGEIGTRSGDAQRGGIHGTEKAQWAKPFGSHLATALDVLGPIAGHLPYIGGITPAAGAALVGGHIGLWGGVRALDRATGMSNPVGRFANRFASPPPSAPAAAIAGMVGQGPQAPQAPPAAPAGGPMPGPTPLQARLAQLRNGPGPSGPAMPPAPPPMPPSPAPFGRRAPIDPQALLRLKQLAESQGEPNIDPVREMRILQQANAPRDAQVDLGQGPMTVSASEPRTGNFGDIQGVSPSEAAVLDAIRKQDPSANLQAELEAIRSQVKQAPENPFADLEHTPSPAPEAPMEQPPAVEPPAEFKAKQDAAFAKREARRAARVKEAAKAVKEEAPKVEEVPQEKPKAKSKAEPKTAPMAEAVKEAPKPDIFSFSAHGHEVSIPRDQIRTTPERYKNGVMRRADLRKQVTDQLAAAAPKSMKGKFKGLYTDWMNAKHPRIGASKLEDLITSDKVPLETQSKLWDIWTAHESQLTKDWVEEAK